jgi:hypothetical protein
MICPPILRSPNPSRASLVRHSLYKLNKLGDKQHPCLTPLPVFTLLVFSSVQSYFNPLSHVLLLINLLSHQSIPVPFRICINLVQLLWSDAFCQSLKQIHSSTSISKVHSDIILSIPIASLVSFQSFFKVSLLISLLYAQ